MTHRYTPFDEIPVIHASLRTTFRSGLTKAIAWRRHQLLQLARLFKDNQEALASAIHAYLRKPPLEIVLGEITPVFERALNCASKIQKWSRDESITDQVQDWQKGCNPRIMRQAKGIVLIIAPWNYPMILSLQPLYDVVLSSSSPKLPHITLRSSPTICRSYLDKGSFRAALGGVPEITKMLELKWDHIFYSGNGRVARIIATAAAKHLTPLTLELGGKSPVIIDATADIQLAAKRTLAGKTTDCGQICVTPDFVLVERSVASKFVEACVEVLKGFYLQEDHYERLKGLLDRTKGRIVAGGGMRPEKGIGLTVIADMEPGDSLLERFIRSFDREIFGPFLPIVTVENVAGAIDYINDHGEMYSDNYWRTVIIHLYLFTTNEATKTKDKFIVDDESEGSMLENTTSGNVCINDTFTQLSINEMPFGGVGESGYGRQVQYYSYENFVYGRAVCKIPFEEEPFHVLRYPSYTAESVVFFSQVMKTPIPESTNPAEVEVKN
ncbi:aldehyde dehydrogenase [Pholiota conissans]|uniref:Aldehyde dehydrogenase n=1 Tax=Pholiota conissans TaxID=109636 RepID=A0A9P5YQZ1_9AGAR|nr:aldehyde dehydrogenase [Pholiota conissans]